MTYTNREAWWLCRPTLMKCIPASRSSSTYRHPLSLLAIMSPALCSDSCAMITIWLDKKMPGPLWGEPGIFCIKAWQLFTGMWCMPITQEQLSVTYFINHRPVAAPFGLASLMQKRLSPWMECMQKQCWEHFLSWRFCYLQGSNICRFCRSKNWLLRSSRSHCLNYR